MTPKETRMDTLIASLHSLPQWMHIASGLLVTALMAVLVLAEDL